MLAIVVFAALFGLACGASAAERLTEFVRQQDGVKEVRSDYVPGKPIISLALDYDALARYGLTVGDVSSAVKVAFNGQVVDTFDTIEDTIIYRMQLDGVDVRDPASLYSLAVTNSRGENILLRSLVEFRQRSGEGTVRHFLGDRATTVYAKIDRTTISMLELNRRVSVTPGRAVSMTTMEGPRPSTCTSVLMKSASPPPVT